MSASTWSFGTTAAAGATAPNVNLTWDGLMTAFVGDIKLEVHGDGQLLRTQLAHVGVSNNWVTNAEQSSWPPGLYGTLFETKLTQSTGDAPTGPSLATWHTINTEVQWDWLGTEAFTGTLEIREIADTGNSGSATVTLTAGQ